MSDKNVTTQEINLVLLPPFREGASAELKLDIVLAPIPTFPRKGKE